MHANRLLPLLFVVAVSLSACDSSTEDRYDGVTIQTDQVIYDATPRFAVTLTIANVGDESVYLACGGAIGIEEWIGGKLNRATRPIGFLCGGIDEVAPGNQFTRTTGFSTDNLEGGPVPAVGDDVRYRFRVVIYEEEHLRSEIDLESQRSNEFEVLR